jgi:hypothetical protein
VCFPPRRGVIVYLWSSPVLGFRGDNICKGAMPEVDQVSHTTWWRGLGLARARGWCGPLVAHLALSFLQLPSSGEIWISGYFPGIAGLQKYGVLTVLFLAESWLQQWILQ